MPGSDRAAQLQAIARLEYDLRSAEDVASLFAAAPARACSVLGFDRGVVLGVDAGRFSAAQTGILEDERSDDMRLRVLAARPVIAARTREDAVIRGRAGRLTRADPDARGGLTELLELRAPAFGALGVGGRVIALLVLDRRTPVADAVDQAQVSAFAAVLALMTERLVTRARMAEMARSIRHLTTSSTALLAEVTSAPVVLPVGTSRGPVFPAIDIGSDIASGSADIDFTERERSVARLLVDGRPNREIAAELFLSQETVKTHVRHILRKVGATNRAEAVSHLLRH